MARTESKQKRASTPQKDGQPVANRPWPKSVTWSAIVMAALLFLAVVVNVAVGRVIHWEIVTGLGVLGFVFLSVGRRYRTI